MRVKNIIRQPEGLCSWFIIYMAYPTYHQSKRKSCYKSLWKKCQILDFCLPVCSHTSHEFAQKTTSSIISCDSQGIKRASAKVKLTSNCPGIHLSELKGKVISGRLINSWNPLNAVSFFCTQAPSPPTQGSVSLCFLPRLGDFINKCSIQDRVSAVVWPVAAFYAH